MKWITLFLALITLFTGCTSKKEKSCNLGPLSKIHEYQVIPLFYPNEAADKEILFNHLVDMLGKLGTVHISTDCIFDSPVFYAGMLISIDELSQTKSGTIKIITEGEIAVNKHKVSCEAWETRFYDPAMAYPVDEENGIAFRRDPDAVSPDLKTVVAQMVEQFAEQYRQDNPGSKPIFHVYSQIF